MAEMDHLIRVAHTASPLIHHTGGVEQLQQVNPQAGPAPAAPCPPQPCATAQPGPPVGPPIAVHEPAAGEHIVVPVVPNQPLTFDFNPLDLKAAEHTGDLILTFPDGAQITLHDVIGPCGPQPVPLELPDGTVITASELLQAFHLSLAGPCGGPALNEINPTAGPAPIVANTGFGTAPFDIGGIGPGLTPDGPLTPTGFGISTEFLHGVGGGNPSPPGPPGPPTPPSSPFLTVPDVDLHNYFLGTSPPPPTHVGGTDYTVDLTGNYISEVVSSSPAALIEHYYTLGTQPLTFGTQANPGTTLAGLYGTFNMDSAGNYSYTLDTTHEHVLSQLGSDMMSQAVNQPFVNQGFYQPGFEDAFDVVTSNGTDTAGNLTSDFKQIQFEFNAATVSSTAATVGVGASPLTTTSMLLTYTDAVDPAHTFQQLVTVDSSGHVVVTPESGTIVQPNDPALVSLEYLIGSGANVSSVSIEGESFNIGATIGPSQHAYAAVINPALDGLGDNGDTGSASAAGASQDTGSTLTVTHAFNDALSGLSGSFGYLYDNSSTTATGGGNADAINYADNSDAATLNGSTAPGATNVFEWSSTALIDVNTHIDGGSGNGLNVLEIESSTAQNLDFNLTLNSDPTTGNVKNVEVFDLTDGAHSGTANSVTLTANDVFNLAQHEPTAVQNAGGAAALWIVGSAADNVTLAGTGSTWTQISQPVTQAGQAGGNASQMVGFTEYAATTTGGQAVHVYVQNAIQNAGHVAHH
ncbi:MAG TPA: VCBS domain-containing protein [Stellaceae bacterium]|nr:VCBS domain-containing protein [Stellaceae bacterium]